MGWGYLWIAVLLAPVVMAWNGLKKLGRKIRSLFCKGS